MSRTTSGKNSPNKTQNYALRALAGLLLAGVMVPALAGQSKPYPTYTVGPQKNGTWVVSDGTIITPAGTQVDLGIRVRAKAIALNPNTSSHTAAVLTLGTSTADGNGAVEVFDVRTGVVLQNYIPFATDSTGAPTGIAYTPDGKYLVFSQDSSHVTIASVSKAGLLSDDVQVSVPVNGTVLTVPNVGSTNILNSSTATCFPNSPGGTTGSILIPCGYTYSFGTSYPTGIAISPDGKSAYAVLDVNNMLTKINLTAATPTQGASIRVGNIPNSVVISPDGKTAYVSNEAGRIATESDFQEYSDGTPVVAEDPTGATATGTVSVINLSTFTVTGSISTGLHPTGMAFWGSKLLVANTYDDSISVIDTTRNEVTRTIDLGLPIGVPGAGQPADGGEPNSIAVDDGTNLAYVALYHANAIAVVDLTNGVTNPVVGMIPVAYAPASVVLDKKNNLLLVANDKGIGARDSFECDYGVCSYNTHQDNGTVSIVPVPTTGDLAAMTQQVFTNNHWDLTQNIEAASGGRPTAKPVVIPAKIGDPSLIQHVFLIIRENRTYDQILGDVAGGNGDPSLAVFGADVTPNAHALVERFPLLDNFYDPSRQSADGHNWILQAMAPYSDDIQSPDWVRDYPSNGGDSIAYQKEGHLFDVAAQAGLTMKIYGEYVEYDTFNVPGCTPNPLISNSCEPSWTDFYNDTLAYESGEEPELQYYNTVVSHSPLPNVQTHAITNYPQFDLGIPDQFRVDVWEQDFANDVKNGTVPQLSIIWISSDHTGGPPTAQAMQADNDLALGRFVDIISHSAVWSSSAIFVEEDDAQNGVDHVDGHRSPGYIFSPYVVQQVNRDGSGAGVTEVSTYFSQVNITRTIEQILGLPPMNQSDLVASPMRTIFTNNPPRANFLPWTHVPNVVSLDDGVTASVAMSKDSPAVKALRTAWLKKKALIFAGKYHIPDSEDPDTVNHLDWYEATGFTRPYPGEKTVRPPSDFNNPAPAGDTDGDE
ncbi:MAG TPA: bifunctional YncE family protein/alkaline phosphatase family protein [Acidobacteriaceae bacterium]|nr:bifunctional YncE family protein/alkaline phosphatase family protein [Acidobacteriaceae bacterium]